MFFLQTNREVFVNLLSKVILILFISFISFGITHAQEKSVSENDLIQNLLDGNQRYVKGEAIHPKQNAQRRKELSKDQNPFAIILSCSDSRVPPEILFDQGLGDLFVIRVAGNIITDEVLGSIEYAVEHLHTGLIIVLGHERCGAVSAAVKGGEAEGHIPSLVKAILPAIKNVDKSSKDLINDSVIANTKYVTEQLKLSQPILAESLKDKHLQIIAARYDLDDGQVHLLK